MRSTLRRRWLLPLLRMVRERLGDAAMWAAWHVERIEREDRP